MNRPAELREEMPMPDPFFAIKMNHARVHQPGVILFPHHWHAEFELLLFVSGSAEIEINTERCRVGEGDLVVVNSNDIHYGVSLSEVKYEVVIVDLSLLRSHSTDASVTKYIAPIAANALLFRTLIRSDEALNQCIRDLVAELEQRTDGYELSVKSHLYRLFTLLLRNYAKQPLNAVEHQRRMRRLQRLAPVFRYIDEHYMEELTVDRLARRAGLSRFHFSRLFKALTARTVTEHINAVRIGKSEELLRDTDKSVSEIALACGYRDVYYFSRLFKKIKKMSPSKLRKQAADGK